MASYQTDDEWVFGEGSNEDRAVYVFILWVASQHAKRGQILSNYYQSPILPWGRSEISFFRNNTNGAFTTPVGRSDVLMRGQFPEELYGKSCADVGNTASTECYLCVEDIYPDGYVFKNTRGETLIGTWGGAYVVQRNVDRGRHWIALFTAILEAYKHRWPQLKTHVNLGLYFMGGSGYAIQPEETRNGPPEYLFRNSSGQTIWGLRIPIPRFHCEAYAALCIFTGVNLVTLWRDPVDSSTTPKEAGDPQESDFDFRVYEYFKRALAHYLEDASNLGVSVSLQDVIDGSEEYLLDQTDCAYSGLNHVPVFGSDTPEGASHSFNPIAEGTFLKLNSVERKVLSLPTVYHIVNRNKRLVATLGLKSFTSDLDTTIRTRVDGKEINSFKLEYGKVMIRVDRY